jgi:hypothetical protein
MFQKKFQVFIAHNVSAVGDVLPARIRALRSKDQGWQNVGGVWRGNEAKRNDLATRNPEPPTGGEALTVLLCEVIFAFIHLYIYSQSLFLCFIYFCNKFINFIHAE